MGLGHLEGVVYEKVWPPGRSFQEGMAMRAWHLEGMFYEMT